jgi:hypothetical protein
VRFAEAARRYIVECHEDYDTENTVARHELWYTKAEYRDMRLAVKEDVLVSFTKMPSELSFRCRVQ